MQRHELEIPFEPLTALGGAIAGAVLVGILAWRAAWRAADRAGNPAGFGEKRHPRGARA